MKEGEKQQSMSSGSLEDGVVKRVFILGSESLFAQGVEILLRRDQDLQLVGEETELNRAVGRIEELRPDVVVVEEESSERTSANLVARILDKVPDARIVELRLTDDTIRIYRGEQIIAREFGDLVQAIKTDQDIADSIDGRKRGE